jgi:hypothetical protein
MHLSADRFEGTLRAVLFTYELILIQKDSGYNSWSTAHLH